MQKSDAKVSLPDLQRMKQEGTKIVGVVAWDYQIAQIVDRAGVEIVSVGDNRSAVATIMTATNARNAQGS